MSFFVRQTTEVWIRTENLDGFAYHEVSGDWCSFFIVGGTEYLNGNHGTGQTGKDAAEAVCIALASSLNSDAGIASVKATVEFPSFTVTPEV
jgi:hypothetical protein